MRILHVCKHCRLGHGNAHVAVDLACEQASLGHEVAYAGAGGEFEELLRACGVQTWNIRQEAKRPSTALDFVKFIAQARKFAPDVIHAHMMGSALFGYAASKLTRAPLVATVHNSFDRHSNIMRIADSVVAVSQAERRTLIERGFPAARISVVLNGTVGARREAFMCADPQRDLSSPCVVAIAGLHGRKGIDTIIGAFATVWPRFPEWSLYIVGDGPDREALAKLANASVAREHISLLGTLNRPSEILKRADVFVLASYADPCALVLSEARAAGCAMIGSQVGGTPEALDGGAAGLLFPAGDVDALAGRLSQLMSSKETLSKWRALATAGSGRFALREVTERYLSVYRSARSRKRSVDARGPSEKRGKRVA